ncbi:759_t:CDS:2 [Funneliformis caledonium]|uniref:759_t:CDS:1 n=1 Tax=Funneliformis caledonium TaxID=1117310 RepID=A0A9N9DBK8_9GLOM|nr:759_t:CDS:2 [Funneliformis caledonium]
MKRRPSQSGSSRRKPEPTLRNLNISISFKTESNNILLRLKEEGYTTPDAKAKELITRLNETKVLYTLKLLFENQQHQFSSQVLVDSLENFANPLLFNHHSKEIMTRLEFHLRAWAAVLEQICFSQIVLCKVLRDKIYNSLAKFAEFHRKNIQVVEEGFNSIKPKFILSNQQYDEVNKRIKKHNYNIDFLLIHLRDTLHSLRDDETWFQEILRRTKELLKTVLNIAPGITSNVAPGVALPNDNCSILSMLTQLRQGLSFKYPVANYYIDWRIMLIIQHNIFIWSESDEKIIGRKFGERILMEYLWSYSEREWNNVVDKSILDSQTKLDEVSNKLIKNLRNTGSFLNDLAGNEPLALPDMLWFGILDLAQNLIQKSSQPTIYGLCYYLAIETLNKAPNSFIQFKAIEILLYLQNINESFSIIKLDFDEYAQKLYENNSVDSLESFQNLLEFVKEKCHEDIGKGKEKCFDQNTYFKQVEILDSFNIIDVIANEMTCIISHEPEDHLCILKCQHVTSLNNLNKLKQKECPICREKFENSDIRFLLQNTIYKNLYSRFIDAGHVLPQIELKHSDRITDNQHEDDSDNSEVDHILIKKKKYIKEFKFNTNILQPKKRRPAYQNVIKELTDKNYDIAISSCQEYLRVYHKSYTMKCILAYAYRCINNYEQALSYLNDAIRLKEHNQLAYLIRGEILFRQGYYENAIQVLEKLTNNNNISSNLMILLGNSYYSIAENLINDKEDYYDNALKSYNLALQKDSKNYLCLKYCAHIYKIQGRYLEALEMLDKLLEINQLDSLILCYYGEILNYLEKYNDSISHFSRAYHIDPENTHILINKAITHYELREYEKALSDLNELIQLDSSNSLAYFYKGLIYYTLGNNEKTKIEVKRCISLFNSGDHLAKFLLYYLNGLFDKSLIGGNILNDYLTQEYSDTRLWSFLSEYFEISDNDFIELGIINNFHKLVYKEKCVYYTSNLTNLYNEFHRFKKIDTNSLSGQVLSFNDEIIPIILPKLGSTRFISCYVTWKINVEKLLSKDCYVEFIVKTIDIYSSRIRCHKLTNENLSGLVGLGWIEYSLPFKVNKWVQPSINVKNNSIIMQIDYVRLTTYIKDTIYIPKIEDPLQIYKLHPNVPKVFNDKYFSKMEMENLIELKDVIG